MKNQESNNESNKTVLALSVTLNFILFFSIALFFIAIKSIEVYCIIISCVALSAFAKVVLGSSKSFKQNRKKNESS